MNFSWCVFAAVFCACGNGILHSVVRNGGQHQASDNAENAAKVIVGYDPGPCNITNNGIVVSLLGRDGKKKSIVCSADNKISSWQAIDGSNPRGEFFNAAYDCSDILENNKLAKDGFYWVKFHDMIPKKVWCDMTTDGGGYMLLARTRKPTDWNNVWSVPSSNEPLEPVGNPRWSSALGNAPILDFRVQMADKGNFDATKAHWSFRLQNKRPIKELMMLDKGGCDGRSPGIGDIAYVKDLQIGKIVSIAFRCSIFGGYHPEYFQMGWAMMNSCLRRPCTYGFGYHYLYPIQVDDSGAFSYSATTNTSGITKGSTAFIGCNKGKCCGCFGPVGGTGDYCETECKAKDGGKVIRHVHAWIWVRSTVPKQLQEQCLEYETQDGNGDAVYYRILGETIIEEGRCPNNGENKRPKDGVMDMLNSYTEELQRRIKTLNQTTVLKMLLRLGDFSSSAILQGKLEYIEQLQKWIPAQLPAWHLCYRASRDGWQAYIFNSLCSYKGETVTLVRVGEYIFGGYTDIPWGGPSGYRWSNNSFVFSLKNKDNIKPFKSVIYREFRNAIYTNYRSGPIFGKHDIYLASGGYNSRRSFANFGKVYKTPTGYHYGHSNTRQLLAGHSSFIVSEVEVFYFR